MMTKAVFIDKDGTLVKDVPYNVDPKRLHFTPGAIDALRMLKEQGFLLVVVSNQSGVAHGYFSEADLGYLKTGLQQKLISQGIRIDDFFFCPHHPDGKVAVYARECECRKPKPGMILAAAEEHNIDLSHSWMIGDILNDVEAGNQAGCKTILINNGNETEWKFSAQRLPTAIVTDMLMAARRIVHQPQPV